MNNKDRKAHPRIKWLAVTDFKDFCSRNKDSVYRCLCSERKVTVYPVPFIDLPGIEPKTCLAHEQYIASIPEAKVIGSSNVVIAKRKIVYDLLVNRVPQFLEILGLFKGEREIIYIEEQELCKVSRLYYPSFVHQIPPNFWNIANIVSEGRLLILTMCSPNL